MSPRAQRFIELQTRVNNLIDSPDRSTLQLYQLVGELDWLGDDLNDDEIREVNEWYNANNREREMEYEDVEWMIE